MSSVEAAAVLERGRRYFDPQAQRLDRGSLVGHFWRAEVGHFWRALKGAAGLPISTGVIEGACRYLVRDRMDITGARWTVEGAEAVLRLRALHASGDFDEYWSFHEACELHRNHLVKYADEIIPSPPPPSAEKPCERHLRLVS